jgi:hypothetical protein
MANDFDQELEASIQRRAVEAPGREHPGTDLLVAYHAGELTQEQQDSVQEHLAWCKQCAALLLGFHDLAEAGTAPSAAQAEDDWRSIQPQLLPQNRSAQALRPRRLRTIPAILPRRLVTGFAASLLAATILLSIRVADLQRTIGEFSQPQVNVLIRDLYSSDSPRDAGGAGLNEVPAGKGLATLILNAADPPSCPDYSLTIEDSAHQEVWQRNGLEKSPWDTFTVMLPRQLLPLGEYRILLFGLKKDRWILIEEFPLRILSDERPQSGG